jgi:CRISPR-associated protein Cmr5
MATLDQRRAQRAFADIEVVKGWEEAQRKKYASMVHAMPALLRSAGLSQALHFVMSRKKEEQKKLLDHLAVQLRRIDDTIRSRDSLLDVVRKADFSKYLLLTNEALSCINWYRRFVQGELKIEAGNDDDEA